MIYAFLYLVIGFVVMSGLVYFGKIQEHHSHLEAVLLWPAIPTIWFGNLVWSYFDRYVTYLRSLRKK